MLRELRNTIERAVILCNEGYLTPQHLPPSFGKGVRMPRQDYGPSNSVSLEVGTTVDEAERRLILKTWNRRIITRQKLRRFWPSA